MEYDKSFVILLIIIIIVIIAQIILESVSRRFKEEIFEKLFQLKEVEAITLKFEEDNEVYYVYVNGLIDEEKRKEILKNFDNHIEIENSFRECGDCIKKDEIEINIIYRDINDFMKNIEKVVKKYKPSNAYTTCMWHSLITCKILYDKNGLLQKYKDKYSVSYPKQLKKNIIKRQLQLLDSAMSAYPKQIEKAVLQKDFVDINYLITKFLASYFDLILAVNEIIHPGEKRLVQLCKDQCKILPRDFEENLELMFFHMYNSEKQSLLIEDIQNIVNNVKMITGKRYY